MPAYNFKYQFAPLIRSGKKTTTIRPCRKKPTQAGDVLHLFTGQRTKQCERIGTFRCVSVRTMVIYSYFRGITIDDKDLDNGEIENMAMVDGFENTSEFFNFFSQVYGTHPLEMELITWEPL